MSVLERCPEVDGFVVGCKFIIKTDSGWWCRHAGNEIDSCSDCSKCPRCGGMMMGTFELVLTESPPEYLETVKCLLCSHQRKGTTIPYMEAQAAVVHQKALEKKQNKCQVEGCMNVAYEGLRIKCDDQFWVVCTVHRIQVKTWKVRKFSLNRFPMIVVDGMLTENPAWRDYSRCGRPKC